MIKLLFFMFTLASSLYGLELGPLYQSLDPLSITENAAFAELYPDSPEGELAKNRVWSLLFQDAPPPPLRLTLPFTDLQGVVSLISKHPYPGARAPSLSDEQLALLQAAGQTLHHHKLLGSKAFTEEEILRLPPEEIDVARAVLLCQFPSEDRRSLLVYEASLDLMALQIRARLPLKDPSPEEILYQMNQFIFQEMGFRFPPRSVHIQDIDLYTFLPSVLDSRRGVCLGVSILFFSLAQRLGLPLEVITPPGHIYLRYLSKEGEINIETTARGIHIPTDHYLGINTRSLPVRTPKEVVGLALINQASVCWGNQDYKTTVALYEQAKRYLPDDPLLSMLLGLNYLFLSEEKKGKALLASLDPLLFPHAVSCETLPSDYLRGRVDIEGLKTVFLLVDESRDSLLLKKEKIERTLHKYPKFRAGLLQLAHLQFELGRESEALRTLLTYHAIDPTDATVEYYLSILSLKQMDYPKAWAFLRSAQSLTKARDHNPRALKELSSSLRRVCPPP